MTSLRAYIIYSFYHCYSILLQNNIQYEPFTVNITVTCFKIYSTLPFQGSRAYCEFYSELLATLLPVSYCKIHRHILQCMYSFTPESSEACQGHI